MAEIKDTREIEKILRTAIIENSGIDGNYVRNVMSEFSADLDEDYNSSIFKGLDENNVVVLFELVPDDNDSNMSEDIYNSKNVAYYKYFKLKVIVYGGSSCIAAMRISSRLRSLTVRDELIAQGINIANVSEISEINEVVNGVVWQRNDFSVLIGCKIIIEPLKEAYEIEDYTTLGVYRK